eukprot:1206700-Pyramimonas_sp.AAC.1
MLLSSARACPKDAVGGWLEGERQSLVQRTPHAPAGALRHGMRRRACNEMAVSLLKANRQAMRSVIIN